MPQLTLEFSSNLIEKNNMTSLFKECHSVLGKYLPTDIDSCKSRSIECHSFYIGNGEANNAFVHVALKIMPGRSFDTLKSVGEHMMTIFKKHFESSLKNLDLQITLEIMELQETYFKIFSYE